MGFKKDYAALLAAAWDIDIMYDSFLTHPDEDSEAALRDMGLDEITELDQQALREKTLEKLASDKFSGHFKDRYINPFGWTTTERQARL